MYIKGINKLLTKIQRYLMGLERKIHEAVFSVMDSIIPPMPISANHCCTSRVMLLPNLEPLLSFQRNFDRAIRTKLCDCGVRYRRPVEVFSAGYT